MPDAGFDLQPTLEGELLRLRPLRADDYAALYAVAADPLIWELHPDRERYKDEVFRGFFRDALASGGALLILDRKAPGGQESVIGSSRYHGFDPLRGEIEIGWTFLARPYWGGVHNGELKRLMIDHAFRFVRHAIFVVGDNNWRSQRAMEKIGGVRIGTRVGDDGGAKVVFRISAR